MTSTLEILRRAPAHRRLCLATAVSQTGDWLLFIALPLTVLRASGSALDTSTVFLAELAPAVLVGMAGGPLIDRCDPGRLLAGLTAAQALLLAPLFWGGPGTLWLIYAVAGVQAAATALAVPAQRAVVPALVDADALPSANAVLEMAANGARLIGSPLGGLLLPLVGLDALVAGDAVSFVVCAGLLFGLRGRRRAAAANGPDVGWRALVAGARTVARVATLRAALAITFLAAVAQGLFLVLFVLFVVRTLHGGDAVVGLLRGVQAIGGVLGGLVVGVWAGRVGARALTVWGLAAFGLVSLLVWNSPALTTTTWWYAALFIAVGIPATALVTGLVSGTQAASPLTVLGRVLSLVTVAEALGQGTGILAAGLLAGPVGLGAMLDVQAGCYLGCAIIAALAFARPARTLSPR